jgi:hypothetical protein
LISSAEFSGRRGGQDARAVRPIRSDQLLPLPVRLHGIQLGRPVDLLLDRDELRVLGLDVRCGDDVHRFLPLPTAIVSDGEITIRSPLVLFEEDELAFYQQRAHSLAALRGTAVAGGGFLQEIAFLPDGTLTELIVALDGHERRVPFDATHIDLADRSAA